MSSTSTVHRSTLQKYLSLVKFSHTIFALPFACIGFALAILYDQQSFKWSTFILMLLCMVFARSAAMAFNRYIDRKWDAKNPRTATREVPAGIISPKNALTFVIINIILFLTTTYFINPLCLTLAPVALFVILFYSYTKRFTALCHLVLGLGLALAPIGAYLTVTGYFDILPVLFSFIVLFWTAGFDIIYASQDADFDHSLKLNSIPANFGVKKALFISILLHILSAAFVFAAGYIGNFGVVYWIGAAIFCGLLIYQHLIVSAEDLSRANVAFANTNGLGSMVFAIFTIADLWLM